MQTITDNDGKYKTTIHLKERNGITYILKEERTKLSSFTRLRADEKAIRRDIQQDWTYFEDYDLGI